MNDTTLDPTPTGDELPPLTGDPATDDALAAVAELGDDLADHVDVLRQAQRALDDWLRRD